MFFGDRRVAVATAIIEADAPLLLRIDAMEALRFQLDFGSRTCVMTRRSSEKLTLEPSPTGHLVVGASPCATSSASTSYSLSASASLGRGLVGDSARPRSLPRGRTAPGWSDASLEEICAYRHLRLRPPRLGRAVARARVLHAAGALAAVSPDERTWAATAPEARATCAGRPALRSW